MSNSSKQKKIAKHVNKLTTNINRWLVKECLDNNFDLTEEMAQLMEIQFKKNLMNFYFDTVKLYKKLKPILDVNDENPPQEFVENPVQYLLHNENFKTTKCRVPGDFPMKGSPKTIYIATVTNRYYYWNNDVGCYSKIPANKPF